MKQNIEYIAGFIVGVSLILILFAIVRKIRYSDRKKCEYDERQMQARGQAYRVGFFTLTILLFANSFIVEFLEKEWGTTLCMNFTCIAIALTTFAGISIFKDAYLEISERPRNVMLMFTIIGILNLVPGIKIVLESGWLNSEDKFDNINIECAFMMGIIMILMTIKYAISKREQE